MARSSGESGHTGRNGDRHGTSASYDDRSEIYHPCFRQIFIKSGGKHILVHLSWANAHIIKEREEKLIQMLTLAFSNESNILKILGQSLVFISRHVPVSITKYCQIIYALIVSTLL